jgi:predicted TIM-barrel fold metal-dependent hydrolase
MPAPAPRPVQPTFNLIDADVHNAFARNEDLLPFLPAYWAGMLRQHGLNIPGNPYASPVGIFRTDTKTPGHATPGSDPAHLVTDHLDRYGIDYAILTGSGILGLAIHPDPDWGNALAAAYNEWLVHVWLPASTRYRGSIIINHSDPAAAVREIHKWGDHPGMVQVLMASASPRPFGQRYFHPIYEAAVAHRLPVAVHPGTEGRGIAPAPTPSGYPTRYMEWHNILPTNYMAHVNSLVCEGVFEKFPTLRFVAVEGGIAWLPHLMWRMDKNYKALRAQTPWLKRLPSDYIREHIKVTTQPIEEPEDPRHLLQIFEMINAPEMILFSSDYPHWDFDNPRMSLPPLPAELKERIFWRNAAALYDLAPAPAPAPLATVGV